MDHPVTFGNSVEDDNQLWHWMIMDAKGFIPQQRENALSIYSDVEDMLLAVKMAGHDELVQDVLHAVRCILLCYAVEVDIQLDILFFDAQRRRSRFASAAVAIGRLFEIGFGKEAGDIMEMLSRYSEEGIDAQWVFQKKKFKAQARKRTIAAIAIIVSVVILAGGAWFGGQPFWNAPQYGDATGMNAVPVTEGQ